MMRRFIFEESQTPIYQRIIRAFAAALEAKGHEVRMFRPRRGKPGDLIKQINNLKADFCFITNPHCFFTQYLDKPQKFVYELIKSRLIFIHHDNFFGPIYDSDDIRHRFEGFQRTADRSSHFCIENSNVDDLIALSIPNAYKIYHASEFSGSSAKAGDQYDVSFVGHVLPASGFLERLDNTSSLHRQVANDFSARSERLEYKIGDGAAHYAEVTLPVSATPLDRVIAKQAYTGFMHNGSLFFRGKLITQVATRNRVDIIGGDPSYMHGGIGAENIDNDNLVYHAPTTDYSVTRDIYSMSKINLNITPLQFDTAIINRVMDAGAVGGFVLTDYRKDLSHISVADQIAYRTAGELCDKVDDFLANDSLRQEVAAQLQRDIHEQFTYDRQVDTILEKGCP